MAKICPITNSPVLYLDCLECEERECERREKGRKKEGINVHRISVG